MAKTVSLSGSDLAPKSKAKAAAPRSATRQRGVPPSADLVPLQFRMPADFVKDFKQAALDRDMKMNKFLEAIFHEFMNGKGKA